MARVNVILCTYNGERFLPELLDSLLAQTHPDISIYARDDHSTDGTLDILRAYREKATDRIHLVEDDLGNLGYARNFMRTIRASGDADYYAFCDQDDYWFPDKVQRAVEALGAQPQDRCLLYSSNYDVCDEKLNVVGQSHAPTPLERLDAGKSLSLYDGGWLLGFTLTMNRALKRLAFDNTAEKIYSHDIWVQAVAVGFGGKLITDDKVTVYFRRHDKTTSVAETNVNSSFLAAWKYRLAQFSGNGKMFDSVHNGIVTYAALYADKVPGNKDADFLRRFKDQGDGKNHRLRKALYPHRLKQSLPVEAAWRLSILMGKI